MMTNFLNYCQSVDDELPAKTLILDPSSDGQHRVSNLGWDGPIDIHFSSQTSPILAEIYAIAGPPQTE
jgi:hypothetical protein